MKSFFDKSKVTSFHIVFKYKQTNDLKTLLNDEELLNYDLNEFSILIQRTLINIHDLILLFYLQEKNKSENEMLKLLNDYNFNIPKNAKTMSSCVGFKFKHGNGKMIYAQKNNHPDSDI